MKALRKRGVALLQPADVAEALAMLQLHGTSVELGIIHREGPGGKGEPGLKFLTKVKQDSLQSDLPLILTSEKWGDAEFAEHQKSPAGANAYLNFPCDEEQLFQMIEAVIGPGWDEAPAAPPAPVSRATPPKSQSVPKAAVDTGSGLVLEEVSGMVSSGGANGERSDSSIFLEAPDAGEDSAPPPSASTSTGLQMPEPSMVAMEMPVPSAEPSVLSMELPAAEPSHPMASAAAEIPTASAGIALASEEPAAAIETASAISLTPVELTAPEESAPEELSPEPVFRMPEPGRRRAAPAMEPEELPAAQDEEVMAQEMPYLFGGGQGPGGAEKMGIRPEASLGFAQQPVGDAVVPGGAAHSPDLETLKKYLLLREQDVAALSAQLKTARDQLTTIEDVLRQERSKNVESGHTVEEQKRKIDDFERDKGLALEALQTEINELRFQIKAKTDKARLLEAKVREATDEMERLKERVRQDIRKIRVREKELENRLEIMKKDSEALIAARENKIVELKRKLDLLEFNMDLLQDQYSREKEAGARLRERLVKAAQVVRVAGGLLDASGGTTESSGTDEDSRGQAAS